MALIYRSREAALIVVDELTLPQVDGSEVEYRRLWKQFYNTIAIEGRTNPRCRMKLMPKRYWGQMTEFDDQWRVAETATGTSPISIESIDSTFQYPTRK